jgi:hypothetical protein
MGGRLTAKSGLSFDPALRPPDKCSLDQNREACKALTAKFLTPNDYQMGKTMVSFSPAASNTHL